MGRVHMRWTVPVAGGGIERVQVLRAVRALEAVDGGAAEYGGAVARGLMHRFVCGFVKKPTALTASKPITFDTASRGLPRRV